MPPPTPVISMSFRFNWPDFDAEFIQRASVELEKALNRGKKPSNICDLIRVKELHMGSQAPELDILEIGELSMDRFRGIFKFSYSGDGFLVLETKVQANPLNFANYTPNGEVLSSHGPDSPFMSTNPSILAADLPLIVPMQLKISVMRLRAIVVLIMSGSKGITLSFKTDPLESVLVSSTFDSLPSVRRHLQNEIENRLRDLFQRELPAMVHNLSTAWLGKTDDFRREHLLASQYNNQTHYLHQSGPSLSPPPPSVPPFSLPALAGKLRKKTGSPFSLHDLPLRSKANNAATTITTSSTQKSPPSIAAQSAPAEYAVGGFECSRCESPLDVSNFLEERFSDAGTFKASEQHYFRAKRNIIMRAPTEFAEPDPVLVDSSKMYRKKTSNISRAFRSLFRVPEETTEPNQAGGEGIGLQAIESIGLISNVGESGVRSIQSFASGPIDDSAEVKMIPKAYSTISGAKLSRMAIHDRLSDADPDLVQFEPDEFRSDWSLPGFPTDRPNRALDSKRRLSVSSLSNISFDSSRGLAVKLNIRRKLQSTLAPHTFSESNVLYRSMSSGKRKSNEEIDL